ncbi:MAG: potassium channel family protein [Nanoarchaeota archaeon]|nr:potassium channel family protein [Nanoarchaeota archaeon]MBU1704727.1 potassium channel family protein [Nanoarchaeota archaeon]
MKKYISINSIVGRIKKRVLWFDKLSFLHIFLIWAVVVILFGVVYYLAGSPNNYLSQKAVGELGVLDTVYFSFITATTTGFGDIIPFGGFRILALVEVVCGLLLLAIVTSKLVSIKQNMILDEIYDISLSERVNRIRSTLLLFRQNLTGIVHNVEEGTIKKREVSDIYVYLSTLEDALHQVSALLQKKSSFSKGVDPVNSELTIISINQSFEKLSELINMLESHKIEWKREVTLKITRSCIDLARNILKDQIGGKLLPDTTLKRLTSQLDATTAEIYDRCEKKDGTVKNIL